MFASSLRSARIPGPLAGMMEGVRVRVSAPEGRGVAWTEERGTSEPEGRGGAWTEERGTSDEGRRRLQALRRQAGDTA